MHKMNRRKYNSLRENRPQKRLFQHELLDESINTKPIPLSDDSPITPKKASETPPTIDPQGRFLCLGNSHVAGEISLHPEQRR